MKPSINPLTGMVNLVQRERHVGQGGGVSGGLSRVPDISYGTSTPVDGIDTDSHMYYDTDDSTLYIYVNGMWYPISGGTPPTEDPGAAIFGLLATMNLA